MAGVHALVVCGGSLLFPMSEGVGVLYVVGLKMTETSKECRFKG